MRRLIVVMLAFGSWQTSIADPDKGGTTVVNSTTASFETTDGVKIVADYYPPKTAGAEKAPVAILVHMYPADRKSWKPLVPPLIDAGFAVLAYDIRGTGDSVEPATKKLRKKYEVRDKDHFNNAWRDAEAAKQWLGRQSGCDASRVVMIGASIGCSISMRYGGIDKDVKAVVCLSPGTNYMGVDSIADIKKCTDRAVLLVSPEAEFDNVEKLAGARRSAGGRKSKRSVDLMLEIAGRFSPGEPEKAGFSVIRQSADSKKISMNFVSDETGEIRLAMPPNGPICIQLAGGRDRHGTRMFDAPYGKALIDVVVRTAGFAARDEPPPPDDENGGKSGKSESDSSR